MKPSIQSFRSWKGACALVVMAVLGVCGVTQAADSATTFTPKAVADFNSNVRPQGVPTDYLVTPNGFFSPSCVQRINEGETLHADGRIEAADGSVRMAAACTQAHYRFDGTRVEPNGSFFMSPVQARAKPTINGWVEDANYESSVNIGKIVATWTVPSTPTNQSGQTDYFFPGLEQNDSNPESILQPVLGYDAFSGTVWTLSSWNCCVSGTTYYSGPINVNVGDTILGTTQCKAANSCSTWTITSKDVTSGKSTTLSTDPYGNLLWVFGGVMEVYGVSSCNQLPASSPLKYSSIGVYNTSFSQISNPPWGADYPVGATSPQCSYNVSTTSSSVTLTY
ncbi:hypothetical protein DWU98_06690 [Dyella monticola]|uniref:Uncharacterized protein n=1 Tax=Dyella monticola TaxID=1927958 RepID=A0A370X354_9GAMM|nr:hypothetical protein [Dyella monticola]RDS82829.1 hypothetical protein DWU98_06690 [Dyella monticola]